MKGEMASMHLVAWMEKIYSDRELTGGKECRIIGKARFLWEVCSMLAASGIIPHILYGRRAAGRCLPHYSAGELGSGHENSVRFFKFSMSSSFINSFLFLPTFYCIVFYIFYIFRCGLMAMQNLFVYSKGFRCQNGSLSFLAEGQDGSYWRQKWSKRDCPVKGWLCSNEKQRAKGEDECTMTMKKTTKKTKKAKEELWALDMPCSQSNHNQW